jgi:hypothetical protein
VGFASFVIPSVRARLPSIRQDARQVLRIGPSLHVGRLRILGRARDGVWMIRARRCLAAIGLAVSIGGCEEDPVDCPGNRASFRVLVFAEEEPLPTDTIVRVKYGAGLEEYRLDQPTQSKTMFCELAMRDGGLLQADAGPPVEALLCELWTGGAATVTVTAGGYPDIEQELDAKADECGITTKDVSIRLLRPDAGP